MDKQKLLQQIHLIKESTKSIMKEETINGETSTDTTEHQEQSQQTV